MVQKHRANAACAQSGGETNAPAVADTLLQFLLWRQAEPHLGIDEYVAKQQLSTDEIAPIVREDLRNRYHRGEQVSAEWYLRLFPGLAQDSEAAMDLIFTEYLQRERQGKCPDPEELPLRFPQYASQLRLQIQFHQSLDNQPIAHPGLEAGDDVPAREQVTLATADPKTDTATVLGFRGMLDPLPVPHIPGYEILCEVGRGGMGVVYQARHLALHRLVALKMLLAGEYSRPGQIQRLRAEAEALARLGHPNIARIYEVGTHQGRPFLAMEYVDGASLATYCGGEPQSAEWSAAVIENLARAVDFAHQHAVVHRDLKPANVLLVNGANGDPADPQSIRDALKIIDFGLAKLLDLEPKGRDLTSIESLTRTGDVLGTPGFMAPEQIRGEFVGPAADIHALGVMLYTLLTGTAPFRGATQLEILQHVVSKPPAAPSRLVWRLPADLETICLKCLEKSPTQRYRSALELADDLQRFLEHRPILARRASISQHVVRWGQRNPVVASLLGSLMLLMVTGITALSMLYAHARGEATRANANFTYARDSVDTFLTKVADSPELKAHGLETLRRNLLATARDFYEALSHQPAGAALLRDDLAQAHWQLGKISQELGDYDAALAQFQKTHTIYDDLVRKYPDNLDYLEWNIFAITQIAQVQDEFGQHAEAELQQLSAMRLNRQLFLAKPDVGRYRFQLLSILLDLTRFYGKLDRPEDDETCFVEACQFYNDQASWADSVGAQRLGNLHNNMGAEFHRRGMLRESEQCYRRVIEAAQRVTEDPSDEPNRAKLEAMGWSNLAQALKELGQAGEALQAFQKSQEILMVLTRDHPLVLDYQEGLANVWLNLGGLEFSLGEISAAESAWTKARQSFLKIAEDHPQVPDYRHTAAVALSNLGNAAVLDGKYKLAEKRYLATIEELRSLRDTYTDQIQIREHLVGTQANLAAVYQQTNRFLQAVQVNEELLQMCRTMTSRQAHVPIHRQRTANVMFNLASACRHAEMLDRAEEVANACVVEVQSLISQFPDQVEYQELLADVFNELGNVLMDAQRLDEADAAFAQAQSVREATIQDHGEVGLAYRLGFPIFNRGRVARNRSDPQRALDWIEQAIVCFQPEYDRLKAGDEQASLKIRKSLCGAYWEEARALYLLGRHAEALSASAHGLELVTGAYADGLRALHARILASSRQVAAAVDFVSQVTDLDRLDALDLVDLAAAHALIAAQQPEFAESYLAKAIELRERARKKNPTCFSAFGTHEDFAAITTKQ